MHATMTDRRHVVWPCQAEFRALLLHFGHSQINSRFNSQLQIALERWMPRQGLGAVMMWRWIKIGVEFIKALVDQRTARSHPNAPSGTEVCTAAEELRSSAHNIAVQLDSEVNIEIKCSPAQKEIERRREMVR